MFRTVATAALLCLSIVSAHAEHTAVAVSYGDLNLSSPRDAGILAERLQDAANLVCLNATETKAPIRKLMVRKCVDAAVAKATAQIQSELEASPNRTIRANLVSVRQKVASADISLN